MEYLSKVAKQHILRWIKNRKYFDEYPFSANFAKETHYFDMKTYWVDILTFFCVVILCFFTADVLAKGAISQKYSVTYFSSQNGVEDGLVNDIIQDHKGLLWFATWNGLYRFDGYNFKNYKSNMEDLGGLTNDRLLDIVEDKFGCIWVLCYDSTCYRFNPDKEVFEPVIQKTVNNFRSISVLPNGIVWLLCEDGSAVRVVTAPEDLSMTFQFYSSRENTLATGKIRSVFMDSKLQEWLLTDEGVYRLYDSELSIISLSDCRKSEKIPFYFATELEEYIYLGAHQGKVYKYLLTGELSIHTQLPTSASVISILPSVAGLIYVTDSDGFFIHDSLGEIRHVMLDSLSLLKDKNIESAKITCGDLLWLVHPVPGVTLFDLKTQRLSFIEGKDEQGRPLNTESDFFAFEDRNDILWVHPKGGGFSYFDSQNRRLIPFNTTEQPVKWKSNDRCFAAFVDKQGNLWMSTQLNRLKRITFIPDKFHIYTPAPQDVELPDNEIRALYIDKKQRIWTGSRDMNVSIYDARLRLLKRMKWGKVYAIMQDSAGVYWISTKGQGLIKAIETSQGNFKLQHFKHKADDPYSLSNDNIYFTFQDSRQRLWVATYGGGLNLIETMPDGTLRFINHRNLLKRYPISHFYKVRHITEDNQGRIWVSTTAGILQFKVSFHCPEEIDFHSICREQGNVNSLSNNDVIYTFESKKGEIYIITHSSGLNLVTSKNLLCDNIEFVHLNKQNGLPSDMAYTMIEGNRNELWISFEDQICRYNPDRGSIESYNRFYFHSHLLVSEIPLVRDDKNGMYVALNRDVLYLHLDKLNKSSFIPHIVFTNASTGKNNKMGDSSPIVDQTLTLEKNERNVSITFAALDFAASGNLQYAYRLKNIDKEWNCIGYGHSASLVNLPAGDFVLEVKSTNGDGLWVDNMARLFIHVKPTFWETGWAWLLYVILILLIIVAVSVTLAYIFNLRRKVDFEQQITNLKLRFFTDISHELRTPLTLIASPIEEVIDHEKLSEEGRENMLIAKKNTDRMLRLINQLLDFRKIQNNKMKLYIEETDIVSLSKKIFETFTALAHQRNINFQFICSCDSYVLYTDIDKFEKIVFNLLSNAFKYTPDGKNIDFILEPQNDVFFFKVRDEGNGIELQKIDMLFKRFETLGYTDPNFSSGIGLSLVKELVDMLHGSIMVDSKLGQGSVFSVSLSRSYEVFQSDKNVEFILNDSKTMPSIETQVEQKEEFIKDITVLVVDDNEELRYFIVSILRKEYHIIEAENGKKGLEIIRLELPDLVLSDVMMPCMDGIELLEEVKKNHDTSHIPFVLLSAKSALDDRIRGLEYGADDYITKPFSSGYLRARISSLLKQREMLHDYFMKQAFRSFEQENLVASSVSLDSFSPSIPQITSFDEVFIQRVIQVVESKLQEQDFKIEDLADTMKMGRTVFYRKVKSILGVTPIDLVKDMRVKRAIQLLDSGNYNISQVAYMSGFSSPQYFSRVFKELKNCTPSEYKTKAFD